MNASITRFTKALIIFVIIDFLLFFILEAIFWMQPLVYDILLTMFNNPPSSLPYSMHALVLKKLFINQGFYNLFLAVGGMAGLYYLNTNRAVGYALILLVSFSAVGAGLVLALTSNAYLLSFLQAVPAAVVFAKVYPSFKKELTL